MNQIFLGAFPARTPGTGPAAAIPRHRDRSSPLARLRYGALLRDFRLRPWPGSGCGALLAAVAILLICGVALSAEESIFDHPVNAGNRSAMLAACQRIAANPVVTGTFTQTKRIVRLKKDFVSTGIFIFSGQLGVYWEVKKPFPSTTIMTADKLVQKNADGKSSVMDASGNATFKRFADTIQAVFAGRIAAMEKDFQLYFLPQGSGWRLGLIPKEASVKKVIASMEIQGDGYIQNFRLTEGTGDLVSYQFADCRLVQELSADEKQLFLY